MTSPMFSIIMPVWNRANVVGRAIESVLAQKFKDYELLIIDDGSDDDTAGAVRPYLSDTVRLLRQDRQGVCAARNRGLREAKGRYVAYLDSDNVWHPDFLFVMSRALSVPFANKQAAYCKCRSFKKDPETGDPIPFRVVGREFDFSKLVSGNYIDLNTFVHAKECSDETGVFDESLKRLNDWEFILRLTRQYEPRFVNKVLVDYYLGVEDNAITVVEDGLKPYLEIKDRFKDHDERIAYVWHDGICFEWKGVEEKKYHNWLKMSWHDLFNTSDYAAPGFPYMLQIEPTSLCNLSCPACPAAAGKNKLGRERRHMTLDEFQGIVEDMEEYLLYLVLWDWGEPFMNPQLPDMIRFVTDKGIKTITSTNAHFLHDEEYLRRILTSGLTMLIVAIDSLEEESYQSYRQGGSLAKAMAGLRRLIALKKELGSLTQIHLRMVIMKSNEHELSRMKQMARKLKVDKFSVKTANPTCGQEFLDEQIVPIDPRYRRYAYVPGTYQRIKIDSNCRRAWHMSNVLSNGDVVPCCYDFNAEMKTGNVFEQPFREIWNSPAYRELRRRICQDKDSLSKCSICDINYKPSGSGWVFEVNDYNLGLFRNFVQSIKDFAKDLLPQRIVKAIRGE